MFYRRLDASSMTNMQPEYLRALDIILELGNQLADLEHRVDSTIEQFDVKLAHWQSRGFALVNSQLPAFIN